MKIKRKNTLNGVFNFAKDMCQKSFYNFIIKACKIHDKIVEQELNNEWKYYNQTNIRWTTQVQINYIHRCKWGEKKSMI